MRAIFRILSFFVLVAAVVVGVFDCVQSFAAGSIVLTPLRITLATLNTATAEVVENFLTGLFEAIQWTTTMSWLFGQPAVINLLALSFLFWAVGYKKRPLAGRFAA